MSHVRVVIVDDHTLVRAGLKAVLSTFPGVEVVGEAKSAVDGMKVVEALRPDVVLLDISMPDLNGIEAARRISKLQPRTRILVVSVHADPQYAAQSLVAGAHGYLHKSADPSELAKAIAVVASGGEWIDATLAQRLSDVPRPTEQDPAEELTPRQREVLQLIAEGHATGRIARKLRISVKTVEAHRAQIMDRLDIHHVPGLVRYALRHGIITDER